MYIACTDYTHRVLCFAPISIYDMYISRLSEHVRVPFLELLQGRFSLWQQILRRTACNTMVHIACMFACAHARMYAYAYAHVHAHAHAPMRMTTRMRMQCLCT